MLSLAAITLSIAVGLGSAGDVTALEDPAAQIRETAFPDLKRGSSGVLVSELQKSLEAKGFRPGNTDGTFGRGTQQAVLAFQKHHGLERDGVFRSEHWEMLDITPTVRWRSLPDRIEVDLGRQVLYLVEDNRVTQVLPISSGNGGTYTDFYGNPAKATTPEGRFRFYSQRSYNHESYLGWMYKPYYFRGGYAIHGSPSVPAYPASHGCIRVTNSDMDWLRQHLDIGMTIYVYGKRTENPPLKLPTARVPHLLPD